MDPVFALPALFAAVIAAATLLHWDMRSRGIPARHFGACSSDWREMSLRRAVSILHALPE